MTAQGKITAARLTPGTRVIVGVSPGGNLYPAERKTKGYGGDPVAHVKVASVEEAQYSRRTTGRRIVVMTEDGEPVTILASASQTFWLAP